MKLIEILCVAVVSACLGFGLSFFHLSNELDKVYAELESRPKVLVADYMKIAQLYPNGADSDKLEKSMAQYTYKIRKAGEQGYLVLSSQSINHAPEAMVLQPEPVSDK